MERNQLIEEIVKLKAIKDEKDRRQGLSDLYFFNKDVLGWPDITEIPHKKLCTFVEKHPNKKKLILLPRGHLKSSIVTVGYTCQQVAKNHAIRILIANATSTMAEAFLRQIKDVLLKNKRYRELYGDLSTGAPQWSNSFITIAGIEKSFERKEATVTAYGIGGQLVSQHYDIVILDDIVNRDNVNTKDLIDNTLLSYKDILSLLEPGGTLLILGTRWHYADLYGYILDKDNGLLQDFQILMGKAYYGEWGKGELLWPKKFTWDKLAELKRQLGPYEFSSQYLNEVVDAVNADFKREFFHYYNPDNLRGRIMNRFTIIDPAISGERTADYSVILTVGVDYQNLWYIIDIDRGKYTPPQLIEHIFSADEKHHPKKMGIETFAFQKVLQYSLNDEMRKRNRFIPIEELPTDTTKTKEDRIRALIPRYYQGTILHLKNLPNNDWLEDELLRFPKGSHDDIIDALAYQLQIAFPPTQKVSDHEKKKFLY